MATLYWNFTSSAWGSSTSYFESSKITSWVSGTSDANNSVTLQYRVYYNTETYKTYLQYRIRTKNKSFDTTRNGYLCNGASQYGDSSTYYVQILQGSTSVYKYSPAQVTSASVSSTVLEKLPKIQLSSSGFYNHTASEDGSSFTSPVTIEVTSYVGQALKAYVRLSWCRIYTVSGVKYIEWDNMRVPSTISLCTLPAASTYSWTITYNANGHGTAPSSQTKYRDKALTLRAKVSNVTTGGTKTNYTITGNANGGTISGSSTGSASYTTAKYTYSQKDTGGLNTNSGGTGTSYNYSGSYTANAAATLYIQWSSSQTQAAAYTYTLPTGTCSKASTQTNSYTVAYNANGGTSTPTTATSTITTSYTWDQKWWTAASGGTQRTSSSHVTASETIYPHYNSTDTQGSVTLASAISKSNTTENGYTVTFNANNGSTTKANETATRTISWSFDKWALNSATSSSTYNAGTSYTPSANCTMYATWTPSVVSQGTVTLPTAAQCTRDGYQLLGFSTSDTATTADYAPGASYTPAATITLYAVWLISQTVFPKVYVSGVWKDAIAYVYVNGAWKQAKPNIRVGNEWKN